MSGWIDNSVLNQGGAPMILQNEFAKIPNAGIKGRLFVTTDTKQIFRDNIINWQKLSDGNAVVVETGSGNNEEVAFFDTLGMIKTDANFQFLSGNTLKAPWILADGILGIGGNLTMKQGNLGGLADNYNKISSLTGGNYNFNSFISSGVFKGFNFDLSGITDNQTRNYSLPDANGTFALTSDLTSLVPNNRTLTINGTTYDLSANRSWTVSTNNIYNSNGTITSERSLTMGGFGLSFIGSGFTNKITSAGRLLLGTTTEGTYLLDANGAVRVASTLNLNNFVNITSANNFGLNYVTFQAATTGNGVSASFLPNGNPSGYGYNFQFSTSQTSTNNSSLLIVGGNSLGTTGATNKHVIAVDNSNVSSRPLIFKVAPTNTGWGSTNEHLTLFGTGNLVLQNSATVATDNGNKLQVIGTSWFNGNLFVTAGSGALIGGTSYFVAPTATRGVLQVGGSTDSLVNLGTYGYLYGSATLNRWLSNPDLDFAVGGLQRMFISASTGEVTVNNLAGTGISGVSVDASGKLIRNEIISSIYTPTFSNLINVSGVNLLSYATYIRVNNTVYVNIGINFNPTSANTLSKIDVTLPINTTASLGWVGSGSFSIGAFSQTTGQGSVMVQGVNSSSVQLIFYTTSATVNLTVCNFQFQYQLS